jgi:hypothetical protein
MSDLPACCNFCYRRAARTLVQRRRQLWQVLANKPRRRAAVCRTARCVHVADDYLKGRRGPLR